MKRVFCFCIAFLLLAGSIGGQLLLARQRRQSSPMLAEGVFAAIGGLRSIAAEIIWFRADRLQDEGRYVELVQLAELLTAMEPHTPEVWSYATWNLAYNVSVMMATPEDRWRWVYSGICLLRDQGLKFNPHEAEVYRELAWLFELKLGTSIDNASAVYREKWREIVNDVKSRGAWHELRMEPMRMVAIENASGMSDWTNPLLSAIYWASEGLRYAQGRERNLLLEIIRQSKLIYNKNYCHESADKT